MADLQQTRWDKLLRRTANIVGEGAIVTNTLQEVFPVFDLEDPPAELLLLGGTRLAFGGGTLGSTVGESGRFQVFNPTGSGHIITVTLVNFTSRNSGTVRYGVVNQAIATVGTQRFADTRGVFTALPVGQFNQATSVALAPATGQWRTIANTPYVFENSKGLFVLGPGTGFEIGLAENNFTVHCVIHWRERTALESELDL